MSWFIDNLFNTSPPTPFYLAYLQLIKEGYKTNEIFYNPKVWKKLVNKAVFIRNKIIYAKGSNLGKGNSKIAKAHTEMLIQKLHTQ